MIELDYGEIGQFPNPKDAPYGIDGSTLETHVFLALMLESEPSSRYRGIHRGTTPDEGFDNAGFIKYILENSEIEIPEGVRHINEFFDCFGEFIPYGDHKTGDLVFFSNRGLTETKVGLVLNSKQYIYSPGRDGEEVKIGSLQETPVYFQDPKRKYDTNPIAFKRIPIKD